MEIPKIKRDETNTKIINKKEIINFIKYYANETILLKYKNALNNQTKVSANEVKEIIDAIQDRLDFFKKYNEVSKNYIELNEFYKTNINILNDYFNLIIISNKLDLQIQTLLINFLNFCISNEENGIQNDLNIQNLFNKFKRVFENKKNNQEFKNEEIEFYNQVNDLMNRKDNLINKIDDSAMDYKENDYLTRTQVLSKSLYNIGKHNLEEPDINVRGFIATTIILESSLILTLIVSLIIIFK